jgi:mRNA interferase MazF
MVRGEVFRFRAPREARGAEQRGERFAVVVQSDELLALSTVLISPTSASALPRSFRPVIDVEGSRTRVMVEQTLAIVPERLGASVGRLNTSELHELDTALALVLGL